MFLLRFCLPFTIIALTSGCASVISGDQQKISITVECKGVSLPAYCVAVNSEGRWRFRAPAIITVNKSSSDLRVTCESGTFKNYSNTVVSSPNPISLGNVIAGGILGVAIDYQTSAGLQYPTEITLTTPICRLM